MAKSAATALEHGNSKQDWETIHAAMLRSEVWNSLAVDGYYADADGRVIESRRCPGCGSTLSKRISLAGALANLAALAGIHTRSLEILASIKE